MTTLPATPRPTGSSPAPLGRPPGREAFPGDIFYIHARLLERATHLLSGTRRRFSYGPAHHRNRKAQNISAYIPTNLISITDGQVYLSARFCSRKASCRPWTWASPSPGWAAKPNGRLTGRSPATCVSPTPSLRSWRPSPASGPGSTSAPVSFWSGAIVSGRYFSSRPGDPCRWSNRSSVLSGRHPGLLWMPIPLDKLSAAEQAIDQAPGRTPGGLPLDIVKNPGREDLSPADEEVLLQHLKNSLATVNEHGNH